MDMTTLQKRHTGKQKKLLMLKPGPSYGADLDQLEAERNIVTDPSDNRKRRTLLLQKENNTWGFTLQTYGIRNKKTQEIEVFTYVDYVEVNGPAYKAGMRKVIWWRPIFIGGGENLVMLYLRRDHRPSTRDIIISVNGQNVEYATHQELVAIIKTCGNKARMVVLFVDCCKKVELHDRLIKLKRVLRSKIKELQDIECQEREVLDEYCVSRGLEKFDHSQQSTYSGLSDDSSMDRMSILTVNSNLLNLPNMAYSYFGNHLASSSESSIEDDDQSFQENYADFSYADDSDSESGLFVDDILPPNRRNTITEFYQDLELNLDRERRDTLTYADTICGCSQIKMCGICEVKGNEKDEDSKSEQDNTASTLSNGESELRNEDAVLVTDDSVNGASSVCHKPSTNAELVESDLDDDWEFPFWTDGAICINLDDEDTKL